MADTLNLLTNITKDAQNIIATIEEFQDNNVEELQSLNLAVIYCDGSGTNGKTSAICVIIPHEKAIYKSFSNEYTNNEMEYLAIIIGLIEAKKYNSIIIYSDSLVVVNQITGKYKLQAKNLMMLHYIATSLYKSSNAELKFIPREINEAGKFIEKQNATRN